MRKMNNRGDVPVMFLVLGVLFICLLALLTFFMSSLKTADDFVDIGLIEKAVIRAEQNSFDGNDQLGNFILEKKLVKAHWYSLEKTKEVFSVRYYPKP